MLKIAGLVLFSVVLTALKLAGMLDWTWLYVITPVFAAFFLSLRLWLKHALSKQEQSQ